MPGVAVLVTTILNSDHCSGAPTGLLVPSCPFSLFPTQQLRLSVNWKSKPMPPLLRALRESPRRLEEMSSMALQSQLLLSDLVSLF